MVGAKNAREVWRNIEDHCGSHNRAQIQVYKREIQSNKKGSRSIYEFVLQMNKLADNLGIAGRYTNHTLTTLTCDTLLHNILYLTVGSFSHLVMTLGVVV
ncbi:hypothetical protein Sjap_013032 [Stephania japonica]|uniref:Uncharacterized protein n=1 Tax=Stephania japonica TaxID=461633 RepID=A0AAP0NZH6_9MAGN